MYYMTYILYIYYILSIASSHLGDIISDNLLLSIPADQSDHSKKNVNSSSY